MERLILIDSVGVSGNFSLGKHLSPSLLSLGAHFLRFRKDAACRILASLPFASPSLQDLILCSALHQEMPGWAQSVQSFTCGGGYSDLPERISRVRQPTLILWGDRDRTLGTQDARRFEGIISHSRLVWVKGADHAPHLSNPKAVAKEVLSELECN